MHTEPSLRPAIAETLRGRATGLPRSAGSVGFRALWHGSMTLDWVEARQQREESDDRDERIAELERQVGDLEAQDSERIAALEEDLFDAETEIKRLRALVGS